MNEEILQRSNLTMVHLREEKKMLVDSVPNEFIVIVVKDEDAMYKGCNEQAFELINYGEENEWD